MHVLQPEGAFSHQGAEVLSLPQQPVLAERVQSFARHAVHRAFGDLLHEGAHQEEQVLAHALLHQNTNLLVKLETFVKLSSFFLLRFTLVSLTPKNGGKSSVQTRRSEQNASGFDNICYAAVV